MAFLKCDQCSVKFECRDLLAMHMLEHSFTSDSCRESVTPQNKEQQDDSPLGNGADVRLPIGDAAETMHHQVSSKCEICQKVFADLDSLAMHTLSHANSNGFRKATRSESYPCIHCGTVFSYEDTLALHIMTQHKQNRVPLDLSLKTPNRKRSYDQISDTTSSQRPAAVNTGREIRPTNLSSFVSQTQLTAQFQGQMATCFKAKDRTTRELSSKTPATDSKARTAISSLATDSGGNVKNGNTEAHSDYNSIQSLCSWTSLDRQWLTNYMLLQQAAHSSREMLHLCQHCGIIFLDRAMYYLHSGLHNHNSPLQCNLCGKKCSSPLEFSAHIIHT